MNSREKLDSLKHLNPGLPLFDCDSSEFRRYGDRAPGFNFTAMLEYARKLPLPGEGVEYIRTVPMLEGDALTPEMSAMHFGGGPLQVGICHGHNSLLNAVEWHPSSELLVAVTDLILLLGKVADIRDTTYDSKLIRGFYVYAGDAVVLHQTTLHFAPVSADPGGFRALIILPEMTNAPFEGDVQKPGDDDLLFAVNKWMLVHPDSPQAVRGARVGITGANIVVKTA